MGGKQSSSTHANSEPSESSASESHPPRNADIEATRRVLILERSSASSDEQPSNMPSMQVVCEVSRPARLTLFSFEAPLNQYAVETGATPWSATVTDAISAAWPDHGAPSAAVYEAFSTPL